MSRGYPSLTALLGLVAVAGYQHRDKIAELIRDAQNKYAAPGQGRPASEQPPPGQQGTAQPRSPQTGSPQAGSAQHGALGDLLGGTSIGALLQGGLRDLVDSFKASGHGHIADSWVNTGPNKPVSPPELEQAISPEVLDTLSQKTGLSRQDILARLSRELPNAVDKYTPEGRLPAPT
ncbi:MAG: YidB family protein [Xanthobacteraceae bacterium]